MFDNESGNNNNTCRSVNCKVYTSVVHGTNWDGIRVEMMQKQHHFRPLEYSRNSSKIKGGGILAQL